MTKISLLLTCALMALLAACSTETSKNAVPAEKKVEAPEYITGRAAFQQLFVSARSFAADVQPYRLQSGWVKGEPVSEGKAGIWNAYFASPSKRESKAYTWSGVSGENMPDRGISHGTEDTWSPSNTSARIWDIVYLKVDSDKAFEVAQKHGGEKLTKKDPKQPVIFILDWDGQQLLWHVVYGTNPNEAALRIAVDASTGAFVRTEH